MARAGTWPNIGIVAPAAVLFLGTSGACHATLYYTDMTRVEVLSYTAPGMQTFQRSYWIRDEGEPAWIKLHPQYSGISDPPGMWDDQYWHLGLDPAFQSGSVLVDWTQGSRYNFTLHYGLEPDYRPPGVTSVHQHIDTWVIWAEVQSHIGIRQRISWNAVPTVSIAEDWASPWALGDEVTFRANGYDAEAELWPDTCYLEYRWDWNSDGVWDTDWSNSNEATHAFSQPGTAEVVVQVVDRGDHHFFAGSTDWGVGLFEGETWTDTVTNNVGGSAVPEPSSIALLALAAGGLGAARTRSRKRVTSG